MQGCQGDHECGPGLMCRFSSCASPSSCADSNHCHCLSQHHCHHPTLTQSGCKSPTLSPWPPLSHDHLYHLHHLRQGLWVPAKTMQAFSMWLWGLHRQKHKINNQYSHQHLFVQLLMTMYNNNNNNAITKPRWLEPLVPHRPDRRQHAWGEAKSFWGEN